MMAKSRSVFEERGSGVLWALLVLSIAAILSGGLFAFACLEHRASAFALQRELHRITAESGIETLACRLEKEKGLWEEIQQYTAGTEPWRCEVLGDGFRCTVRAVSRQGKLYLLSHSDDDGRASAALQRDEAGRIHIHWGR